MIYFQVLFAACDGNYIIRYASFGHYGSESDRGIFTRSNIGKKLMEASECFANQRLNLPNPCKPPTWDRTSTHSIKLPYVFFDDEAFPSLTNLLMPFSFNFVRTRNSKPMPTSGNVVSYNSWMIGT